MTPTEAVAEFVTRTRLEDIAGEALRRARLALLDRLGVALAGSRYPSSPIVLDFVRECGGAPINAAGACPRSGLETGFRIHLKIERDMFKIQ